MKKKTIIAAVLMLTLLSGCFKNYDETYPAETSLSETASETTETTAESDPTEGSIDPSDMTMASVDIDSWKITTEQDGKYRQDILFEHEGRRFAGRVFLPESAAGKYPTVVIMGYSPVLSSLVSANKGCIEGITSKGMACIMIEAFGKGDSLGNYEELSIDNVNEILTVFFSYIDKIEGVDNSKVVLWSNTAVGLLPILSMKDKCDKVSAIVMPGPNFLDGAYLRELFPDKEKIADGGSYALYIDQMYDIDAEDFFKEISTKVFVYTAESGDQNGSDMIERYVGYFPDKVWEQTGTNTDYERSLYNGKGVVFDKIMEDLEALFSE